MGKDTVVIRAVVDDSVKKPVMRYPERVRYLQLQFVYAIPLPTHPVFVVCCLFTCLFVCRDYYCQYGECVLVHSSNLRKGNSWSYVVVLKFHFPSVANRVKQRWGLCVCVCEILWCVCGIDNIMVCVCVC